MLRGIKLGLLVYNKIREEQRIVTAQKISENEFSLDYVKKVKFLSHQNTPTI